MAGLLVFIGVGVITLSVLRLQRNRRESKRREAQKGTLRTVFQRYNNKKDD